jgi:hypothetical protein
MMCNSTQRTTFMRGILFLLFYLCSLSLFAQFTAQLSVCSVRPVIPIEYRYNHSDALLINSVQLPALQDSCLQISRLYTLLIPVPEVGKQASDSRNAVRDLRTIRSIYRDIAPILFRITQSPPPLTLKEDLPVLS